MSEVLSAILLGFLLGLRHAAEPDHVLTVSSLVSQTKNKKKAVFTGLFWGVGHGLTLFLLVSVVLVFRVSIGPSVFSLFEAVVGILLIALGARTCIVALKLHSHVHSHHDTTHSHPHTTHIHSHSASFLMGALHGLAGSGSIIVLVATAFKNTFLILTYVSFLGFGSIAGMFIFSKMLSKVFTASTGYVTVLKLLSLITGVLSIFVGWSLIRPLF